LDTPWIEAFKYHKWANLHLLDVCLKLPDDQLQLTSLGTYGTIAKTLHHLVAAEQRYAVRFTGETPTTDEDKDEFPGVAKLRELASVSADQLIAAAKKGRHDVVDVEWPEGKFKLDLGVVIVQALHHGNDHRTHICTILGQHDIPYGDMDVWAYGHATGGIVPVPSRG
jgi:uncharacterized damage-inducible protein DinB